MKTIQIEAVVNGTIDKVWDYWNNPEHITKWAFASDDWEASYAENDLRDGGKFLTRMGAKDGSTSFDFTGSYTRVDPKTKIESFLDDSRRVIVNFIPKGDSIKIVQEFEMENENTEELQRQGWQAILNNFKKHVESN